MDAHICSPSQIHLTGSSIVCNAILRGDLCEQTLSIRVGSNVLIHDNVILRPPWQEIKYVPLRINDFVSIDEGSVVEAASIGSYVLIGKDCVIGNGSVIKDCVRVLDDSYVAPNSVIRPFAIYGGNPGNLNSLMSARLVGELPECAQEIIEEKIRSDFKVLLETKIF